MSGNPSIVIIGAGVGGLTLALALRRWGIDAEILEQSDELREVGAAVGLAANATRLLRDVGLEDPLAQVSTEPARMVHRDGRGGHVIAATPGPGWYRDAFGAPFVGLHRADLQRLLADAVGDEHLHLGCCVEALEERVWGMRVRCSSGASFDAGVVVGADGVHSLTRDWVTGGDEPVYSGTSGFRGLVPAGQLSHMPAGALQIWLGPGAHRVHYPIDGGRLINFLAVVDEPEEWTAPASMEPAEPGALLEAFAGWHPAVTELIGAVPQSPRWGLFARRPLARWNKGPVVLLGDAAHASCHTRGKAPTRQSRMPSCWPRNWAAAAMFRRRCADTLPGAGCGPGRSS
jgi:salicylate hydroxylase